ncbi:bifunctional 4-hydroxy-2-oxoglutarate aldolase/2-dehydro-3-deoxy-phosphogluconate aldolase [Segetibacter koreensis]|uniref:bifunctional 4-hydroxy-2-oxoglutarate aldolase/2-dehydro-3-deoxy-phosphogluconate aldolase n=1 Tax=Segetibacter koreensis TaxID=398037 RepID=UPI0003801D7E|nr:bifunctional 4-hydroxy-2-oxoglutarate aldolase/2-dehydro-3-deoxy-phosphogluconate aldolase [Segetibacter koreensis]
MTTLSQILETKIVAIIRGANPKDVLKIANALRKGGVKALEITINSPKALSVIEEVSDQLGNQVLVGAGTVLDAETARAAISAGAKFIISPTVDIETIKTTKRYGIVSIPGAYTPTEILTAYANGGDLIKVFPASSGIQYIKDIRGPLAHIPLMPTGGINLNNIAEYQKAGAVAFGIASALVDTKEEVTEDYLLQLTDKASKFIKAVNSL